MLDRHGIPYWLDSGTLLGIIRDGRLPASDTDIDLGCWEADLRSFEPAFRDLRRLGYRVTAHHYRGRAFQNRPFKYKITPPLVARRRGHRHIDVTVYWRHGDRAWSPIFHCPRSPHARWTVRWLTDQGARELVRSLWLRFGAPRTWRVPFTRVRLTMNTWSIPIEYLARTDKHNFEGLWVHVPADPAAYLAFRYGDWRTPVDSWNYLTEDGALVRELPEHAIMRPARRDEA